MIDNAAVKEERERWWNWLGLAWLFSNDGFLYL